MNGPEGDLRADKIELFLDQAGDKLDRVEAYGAVTLVSEKRTSDRREALVLRARRAVRDGRNAGADPRATAHGMPGNIGENFDILQGH